MPDHSTSSRRSLKALGTPGPAIEDGPGQDVDVRIILDDFTVLISACMEFYLGMTTTTTTKFGCWPVLNDPHYSRACQTFHPTS